MTWCERHVTFHVFGNFKYEWEEGECTRSGEGRKKVDACFQGQLTQASRSLIKSNAKLQSISSFAYWWLLHKSSRVDLFRLQRPMRMREEGTRMAACPIRTELARERVTRYVTVDNKSLRLHLSAREPSQHKSKMSAMFRGCAAPGLRIF